MTFLEEVRRKVEKEEKACATCAFRTIRPTSDKSRVRTGSPDPGMAQKKRQGVPPAIQYSIFEGGDVFVCPFCCADLARTEAGIPRKCPECGQPIERKQSHDRKKA